MFVLFLTLVTIFSKADPVPIIYSCKEQKIASFEWSGGGLLSKSSVVGKITGPEGDGSIVTLIISGRKAMFKGNNGESPLEIIDPVTFLERPAMGDIFMWKLIPGQGKTPTLLVQFKGYQISGPYIHAWIFKCS